MCCVCLCEYMLHVFGCPNLPKDGVGSSGTGIIASYEPPIMGV